MIAENGGLNRELMQIGLVDLLIEAILHKSILVKRNSSETLAFLVKDNSVWEKMEEGHWNEHILETLLQEFSTCQDQIVIENILLSLMHLSYQKKFKPPLLDANVPELLQSNVSNNQSLEEAIYAVWILINLCHTPETK